jgi:hypothetical protein
MLWGKKIQLEKETQAALDPEMGKGETKAMEREVWMCTSVIVYIPLVPV